MKRMSQLGYEESDALSALSELVGWGLVEPESLVIDNISIDDAVRVHSSGFIHLKFFVQRSEYLIGVTPDMNFSSREIAEEMGSLWSAQSHLTDLNFSARLKAMDLLTGYFKREYERRCRRHAFYEDLGFGGRSLVRCAEEALDHLRSLDRRSQ